MEYSSAEMICVLKVNTQCEACKVKVMQVLQRIRGVYNITIDGEQGTVKVTGRVNPNTLLSVLEKYGKHAEVKYVKFDGEVVERNPGYYYGEHHGYVPPPYGMEHYCSSSYPPLPLPLPCPQHQWYHHYQPSHDYFSQPPPPPPPPPLPPPFWAPPPPPPPRPYGYGPPPLTSFWTPRPPNHHVDPMGEASRENKQNQCAMM